MTCDHQECQDFDPTRETCPVETQLGRLERITKQLREDVEAFSGGSVSWSVDDDGVAHRTPSRTRDFWKRWAREHPIDPVVEDWYKSSGIQAGGVTVPRPDAFDSAS